jgi:predicted enzyme related to lactoylglutathione lyase
MDNSINWFEIPVTDLARAAKFYSEILGVEVKVTKEMDTDMGMFPMDGSNVSGALVIGYSKPSVDGTRVYLNCNGKIDEVLSRVEAAGGKIDTPKTKIGEYGWTAMIVDTEGNMLGLHSN